MTPPPTQPPKAVRTEGIYSDSDMFSDSDSDEQPTSDQCNVIYDHDRASRFFPAVSPSTRTVQDDAKLTGPTGWVRCVVCGCSVVKFLSTQGARLNPPRLLCCFAACARRKDFAAHTPRTQSKRKPRRRKRKLDEVPLSDEALFSNNCASPLSTAARSPELGRVGEDKAADPIRSIRSTSPTNVVVKPPKVQTAAETMASLDEVPQGRDAVGATYEGDHTVVSLTGDEYQVYGSTTYHSGTGNKSNLGSLEGAFTFFTAPVASIQARLTAEIKMPRFLDASSTRRAESILTNRKFRRDTGLSESSEDLDHALAWMVFQLLEEQQHIQGFGARHSPALSTYWHVAVIDDAKIYGKCVFIRSEGRNTKAPDPNPDVMGLRVKGPHRGPAPNSDVYTLIRVAWISPNCKNLTIGHFDKWHQRGKEIVKAGDVFLVIKSLQVDPNMQERTKRQKGKVGIPPQPRATTRMRNETGNETGNAQPHEESRDETLKRVAFREGLLLNEVCVDAITADDDSHAPHIDQVYNVDVDRVCVTVMPSALLDIFGREVDITNTPIDPSFSFLLGPEKNRGVAITLCNSSGKMLWAVIPHNRMREFKKFLPTSMDREHEIAVEVVKRLLFLRLQRNHTRKIDGGFHRPIQPSTFGTTALPRISNVRCATPDLVGVLQDAQNDSLPWSDNDDTDANFFIAFAESFHALDDPLFACLARVNWAAAASYFTKTFMLVHSVHGYKGGQENNLRDVVRWVFHPETGSIWRHGQHCFFEVDVARTFSTFAKDECGSTMFPLQFQKKFAGDTIPLVHVEDRDNSYFVQNFPIGSEVQYVEDEGGKEGFPSGFACGWAKVQPREKHPPALHVEKVICYPTMRHFLQSRGIDENALGKLWKSTMSTLEKTTDALLLVAGDPGNRKTRAQANFAVRPASALRLEIRIKYMGEIFKSDNDSAEAGDDGAQAGFNFKGFGCINEEILLNLFKVERGEVEFYTKIEKIILAEAFNGKVANKVKTCLHIRALNLSAFAELGIKQVKIMKRGKYDDGSTEDKRYRREGMCTVLAQCGVNNHEIDRSADIKGMRGVLENSQKSGFATNPLHAILATDMNIRNDVETSESFARGHLYYPWHGQGLEGRILVKRLSGEKGSGPYCAWQRKRWKPEANKGTTQKQIDKKGVVLRKRLFNKSGNRTPWPGPGYEEAPVEAKTATKGGHWTRRPWHYQKDLDNMIKDFKKDFVEAQKKQLFGNSACWLEAVKFKQCQYVSCLLCRRLDQAIFTSDQRHVMVTTSKGAPGSYKQ